MIWWILIFLRRFYKDVLCSVYNTTKPTERGSMAESYATISKALFSRKNFHVRTKPENSAKRKYCMRSCIWQHSQRQWRRQQQQQKQKKRLHIDFTFFSVVHQMSVVMSSTYLHPSELAVTDAMRRSTEITENFNFKFFLLFVSYLFMWGLIAHFTPTR